MRAVASFVVALAVAGCSGENEQEPMAPKLTTPGSFVAAFEEDIGAYRLLRVLRAQVLPNNRDAYLHISAYREQTSSFEEAEDLAKNKVLTLLTPHAVVVMSDFETREWKVVWYRTLTAEEEAYLAQ